MKLQASLGRIKEYKWLLTKGVGTPLLVLASLGMVVLPIPPLMLDILFSFNIALSRPAGRGTVPPDRPYC